MAINITISDEQLKELKAQIVKDYEKQLNRDAIINALKTYRDFEILSILKELILYDERRRQELEYINPIELTQERQILLHLLLLLQNYC